jgi:hypothetical protein
MLSVDAACASAISLEITMNTKIDIVYVFTFWPFSLALLIVYPTLPVMLA